MTSVTTRIGFVAAKVIGTSTWVPAGRPRSANQFQQGDQLRGAAPLTGRDDESEWLTCSYTMLIAPPDQHKVLMRSRVWEVC
jgi:hypothetical protein